MGFEKGKGLGKNKQGITTPVEAVKRKGAHSGIAFHGTERSERSLIDFPTQDVDEEETKEFKEQLSQWRKEPEVGVGHFRISPHKACSHFQHFETTLLLRTWL